MNGAPAFGLADRGEMNAFGAADRGEMNAFGLADRGSGWGEVFEDVPEHAAEPAGGEAGSPGGGAAEGFVDGDDAVDFEQGERGVRVAARAGRAGEDLELRLNHFEAAGARAGGLKLAVEGDGGTEGEAVLEIPAVEPHGFDGGGALADGHFEEGHAGGAKEGGATDLAENGGHRSGFELGDGLGVETIFVAEGEVVEEVFDGVEVFAGEFGGDALADALDEAEGCGELEHWL